MEYQVPQFIEVEDKVVGPLSLKQFIYVAGAIGLSVVFFLNLPFMFAVLLSIPVAALGGALAFYKVNNKPFIEMLEAAFNYYVRRRLLIWKGNDASSEKGGSAPTAPVPGSQPIARPTPKLTRGKLSELAWSLDVKSNEPPAQSD